MATLLDVQREAVNADDPVLCLLAGAGTGKTRVLTLRVARRLADRSAHPDHVLVCTFSRKAADELQRRLWSLGAGAEVRAGTFHRTALGLLRQWRADRNLAPPVLLADRRALLAEVLGGAGTGAPGPLPTGHGRRRPSPGAEPRSVRRLEAEIGWSKARLVRPDGYEAAARATRRRPALGAARVADLYLHYEEAKRRRGVVDLDDLPLHAADLLDDEPRFAAAVRWRFRHLLVDEMQDVNPAQFRLLRGLAGEDPDLFVVGDPNQSVYAWNGADPALLDTLPDVYPTVRVLRMDRNHRCSPQVVAVAVAALGLAGTDVPSSSRPPGPAPRLAGHATDGEEAAWVARQVWLSHRAGRRWAWTAVLARTNAQLQVVAAALDVERVPYHLSGSETAPAGDVRAAVAPGSGKTGDSRDGGESGESGDGKEGGEGREGDRAEESGAARWGERDAVTLSTFHRAKGLQWPTVFAIGLSDGLVPLAGARSPGARDEERRLLYVALTRAEDELTCTWSDAGGAGRSPWLADVQQVVDELAADEAPPDQSTVAAHLAGIRHLLGQDASQGGTDERWLFGR